PTTSTPATGNSGDTTTESRQLDGFGWSALAILRMYWCQFASTSRTSQSFQVCAKPVAFWHVDCTTLRRREYVVRSAWRNRRARGVGGSRYTRMIQDSLAHRLRRPEVRGKYLFVQNQKLLVRGTTYGTFRADARGN